MEKHKSASTKIINYIIKIFLYPSSLSRDVEIYLLVSELAFFAALIHFDSLSNAKQYFSYPNYTSILINLSIVLLRALTNAVLFRPLYMICLLIAPFGQSEDIWGITIQTINGILLVLNLAINILSHIDLSFRSPNPFSETLNFNQFAHNITMMMVAALYTSQHPREETNDEKIKYLIIHGISLVLFTILWALKIKSSCKDKFIKELLLRFYSFCIIYEIQSIILGLLSKEIPYLVYQVITILLSQVIYTIVRKKCLPDSFDINNRPDQELQYLFQLLVYHYTGREDKQSRKLLENFVKKWQQNQDVSEEIMKQLDINGKKTQNIFNPDFSEEEPQIFPSIHQKRQEKIFQAFQTFLETKINLKNQNQILLRIFLSQLYLLGKKQLLLSKLQIQRVKKECVEWCLTKRICLYKQEIYIKKALNREEKKEGKDYLQPIQNELFFLEIIRNSHEYLKLWEYIELQRIQDSFLSKKLRRLTKKSEEIRNTFEKRLQIKAEQNLVIYSQYLYFVEGNVEKAGNILRELQIFPQNNQYLNIANKMYIKICLDSERFLTIEKISGKSKKLLGYLNNCLIGANISILLPQFYRKTHQTIIEQLIHKMTSTELTNFKKQVIIRHADGHYLPGVVQLKIRMEQNTLFMEGLMEVMENHKYEWDRFFFICQPEGKFIEMSEILADELNLASHKDIPYTDFLSQYNPNGKNIKIGEAKTGAKYLMQDGVVKEFQILKTMQTNEAENIFYQFYVQVKNQKSNLSAIIGNIAQTNIKRKFNPFIIKQNGCTSQYLNKKHQIQSFKYASKVQKLAIFICLLFLVMFFLSFFLIAKDDDRKQAKQIVEQDLRNIVQQYNYVTFLTVQVNNFRLFWLYQFRGPGLISRTQLKQRILLLSTTNAYLQKYAIKKYTYKNPNSPLVSNKKFTQIVSLLFTIVKKMTLANFESEQTNKEFQYFHKVTTLYYSGPSEQCMNSFQKQLNQVTDNEGKLLVIITIFQIFISVSIFFIIVCIKYRQNKTEHQILETVKILSKDSSFKERVYHFLKSSTGENEQDWNKFSQKTERKQQKKNDGWSDFEKSGRNSMISFENSNRQLIEDSILSGAIGESVIQESDRKTTKNTKAKQAQKPVQITKQVKISKIFIVFWLICMTLMILIPIITTGIKTSNNYIFLEKSLQNVIKLYNKFQRLSNVFSLHLASITYPESREMVISNLASLQVLQKQTILFDEISNPSFENFAKFLRLFEFQPICSYIECLPTYQDYASIPYPILFHKVESYIKENVNNTDVWSNPQQLKSVLYSFELLKTSTNMVINEFLQDLVAYKQKQEKITSILEDLKIALISLVLVLFIVYWILDIAKQTQFHQRALDIVKKQNYVHQQINIQ